jgi:hypothetical protein
VVIRRSRAARAALAVVLLLGVGAALSGCRPVPTDASVTARLIPALEKADLGWTAMSAGSGLDGFAHHLDLTLTQDEDTVDDGRLLATLEIVDDRMQGQGLSNLRLGIFHRDVDGGLLPVWPAATDLGFTRPGHLGDTDFDVPLTTVHEVLSK